MLHAVPPPQTLPRWQAHATAVASAEFERSRVDFERVARAVRVESPVPTTFTTTRGDVAGVLAQQARLHPYGMVVLGRASCPHDYGPPGSIVARTLLLGRVPVLGYTPLMLVIAFFGGLTALGLGIVGQYLWLSLQNSRRRPNFIVKSVDQFNGRR